MDYTIEHRGQITILTLSVNKLNGALSDRLRVRCAPFFEGGEKVILDLRSLAHFDGRGLGAILHWLRTADASSTHVVVCGLSKPVRSLFELLRLHKLVEICGSREDAITAILKLSQAKISTSAQMLVRHAAGE
jgi:anti-sigma B factor antagonist